SSATPASQTAADTPAVERSAESAENHRAAAERLLLLLDMQKLIDAMLDASLKGQIETNPDLARFSEEMRAFLKKYMSWESLKDDLVRIYMDAYTQRELEDILAFYATPTGKKTIELMPELARKGAEIGQQRVQAHLPELQQAIMRRLGETPATGGPK